MTALAKRDHRVTFYERDVPYYASTRDGWQPPQGVTLRLYAAWDDVQEETRSLLREADVAITTSYCVDAVAACSWMQRFCQGTRVFYDLDTPVTLNAITGAAPVPYLPPEGLGTFDLVLSYTGGRALQELQSRLGARAVAPLYGWVDPACHAPAQPIEEFRAALSYLGTYAADRQSTVETLLVDTARRLPQQRFTIGGAQYPDTFPWAGNIFFVRHLPPALHPAFFCSSRVTLNVTRQAMAQYGYCPSGRLFEAAACGVPIVTDWWEGLDEFFTPGVEIYPASTTAEVVATLDLTDVELAHTAAAARERVLRDHTAERRAVELETLLDTVRTQGAEVTA